MYLLHDYLDRAAADAPHRTAIVCGSERIDYATLGALADRICANLQRLGVTRGDRVVVWLDKSPLMVATWFGVLQAGATYIPLDTASPETRVAAIVAASAARCVVTSPERAAARSRVAGPASCTWVNGQTLASESGMPTPVKMVDLDAAWTHFTSGSTGRPKGGSIPHTAAVKYLAIATGILGGGTWDVIGNQVAPSFDIASFDVHLAVRWGATLNLLPDGAALAPGSMLAWLRDAGLTALVTVPTTLQRLCLLRAVETTRVPSLKHLITTGEPVNAGVLRRLRAFFPAATFRNFYGSTEAPLIAAYAVPEGAEIPDLIPLGLPVTNVDVALRTDEGAIVAATPGAEGEALVRSDILLTGYCGGAEETADAFLEEVSAACLWPARRWYRTRDRVSVDERGQLRYVCRVDHMLKVGGMRLDPSEVEAAMIEQPGITSCAVVGIERTERGTRLIAFFTGAGDGEAIRRALVTRLPRHMVPDACHLEAELPQTASGKVDRKALRALASQRYTAGA